MITGKTGPSDGGYPDYDDDELSEKEKSEKKDKTFNEEVKKLEERRKEEDERKKEQLKKFKKKGEEKRKKNAIVKEEKDKEVFGVKVKKQKDFLSTLKKNEGVFRHNKLQNFNTSGGKKIEKALKRVHGVSSKEKKEFYEGMKAYSMKGSIFLGKEFKEYYMGVKHKFRGFNGKAGFKNMKKNIGEDDINNLKKIKKRSAEKMFNALSGTEKQKYQRRSISKGSSISSSRIKVRGTH